MTAAAYKGTRPFRGSLGQGLHDGCHVDGLEAKPRMLLLPETQGNYTMRCVDACDHADDGADEDDTCLQASGRSTV
jgi:hypothetical protein